MQRVIKSRQPKLHVVYVGLDGEQKYHILPSEYTSALGRASTAWNCSGIRNPAFRIAETSFASPPETRFWNPEIGKLPATAQRKHVLRLEVAMDDIVIVKFSERGGYTQGDLFRFLNVEAMPVPRTSTCVCKSPPSAKSVTRAKDSSSARMKSAFRFVVVELPPCWSREEPRNRDRREKKLGKPSRIRGGLGGNRPAMRIYLRPRNSSGSLTS